MIDTVYYHNVIRCVSETIIFLYLNEMIHMKIFHRSSLLEHKSLVKVIFYITEVECCGMFYFLLFLLIFARSSGDTFEGYTIQREDILEI